MTIQKKEIINYKEVYISCDGREFDNKEDCLLWEKSYAVTMQKSFESLDPIEIDATEYMIPYGNSDDNAFAVFPRSLDDIVVLNAYISHKTDYTTPLDAQCIGKVVILNFGYDFDYCDVFIYEEQIALAKEKLANLTKRFTE